MQRGSDKHPPRLDEQLVHETNSVTHGAGVEGRSREEYQQEPLDDDLPVAEFGSRPDVAEPDGALEPAEVAARTDFARTLADVHFPARRDQLVGAAEAAHAGDEVLGRLQRLPAGVDYPTVGAAWEASGGPVETPHGHGRTGGSQPPAQGG